MHTLTPPTLEGYFWIPETPDNQVPGRFFSTDDGRLQLEVMGVLSGGIMEVDEDKKLGRIVGFSHAGKSITLEHCQVIQQKMNFPGVPQTTFRVGVALFGAQFAQDAPFEFDQVDIYGDAINQWLEFAPIRTTIEYPAPTLATVTFTPPQEKKWELSDGTTVRLYAAWTVPSMTQYREAKITQKTWVSFRFTKATPLDDVLEMVHRFVSFASVGIDQMVGFEEITLRSKQVVQTVGEKVQEQPLTLYYARAFQAEPKLADVRPPFTLFQHSDVEAEFAVKFDSWLKGFDSYVAPFNLYFAVKKGGDLYLDNKFLMLAQACESLHRHTSSSKAFPDDKYKELTTLLEGAVPKEFKDWLEPRLKYGNEPSLRQRLKELFNEFSYVFGEAKKTKPRIDKIVATRNYLTHYDAPGKKQSASGVELYKLCVVLEVLFQLHVLKICGFAHTEIVEMCKKSESFRRKLWNVDITLA